MTRVGLVTIARGRRAHWELQTAALERSLRRPDERILVTMGDPSLARAARDAGTTAVRETDGEEGLLPLARARNLGAQAALDRGVDVLVFLDVDCLPAPALVGAYEAAARAAATRDCLLSGPVTYLDPPPPGGYDLDRLAELDSPHPARPAPGPDEVQLGGSPDLFWSLSFALTADLWGRIGGFHEGYAGYGGEDTDFGWTARARGVPMAWIGGARAYHQHHPVEDPPRRHLDAILRNGALFHRRWGTWPMRGWLDAFVDEGIAVRTADGGYARREQDPGLPRRTPQT
ncbi:galactosyltransferase-related protein [Agrococcus sp. SCSIO52902]|uniref:glycosyltransferase family 2 protein n=1 Tax=Agrococcus sp. SCSIO52902 TaxID=2933290 RepID=UPI001FF2CCAE|nr:galactosyltransferase-related protein [Agrococcus sp. SCSIO52902]UOV99760.1 glycosyltransferase family 2 protein [Agrococcus sp. SCSIO52902]